MGVDVKSEIDTMLKTFENPSTEEPIVEEEVKEEIKDEIKDEEVKDEEVKDEESKEVKDEGDSKEEVVLDEKDKIIEDLRRKLADKEEPKKEEIKEEVKEPIKEEPFKFEEQDFVGDLDLDELVRDPTEFNKLLNKVYQQAANDTKKILGESVLRSIPDIVKNNITIMSTLKAASDKFYEENKDLVPFKKVVATVFEDLAAKNPDKGHEELLIAVGEETRNRLNLQKKVDEKKSDPPPRLPHKGGKSGKDEQKPNLTPMQQELDGMNKSLGR